MTVHLKNLGVKVLVVATEKERLEKFADALNGKKLSERLLLCNRQWEIIYHFPTSERKKEFQDSLQGIFGFGISVHA